MDIPEENDIFEDSPMLPTPFTQNRQSKQDVRKSRVLSRPSTEENVSPRSYGSIFYPSNNDTTSTGNVIPRRRKNPANRADVLDEKNAASQLILKRPFRRCSFRKCAWTLVSFAVLSALVLIVMLVLVVYDPLLEEGQTLLALAPIDNYNLSVSQGVAPRRIHSHNDYQQRHPFYFALSEGCASIEADIFLKNGTLFVTHTEAAIIPSRTLDSLYIEPLVQTAQHLNTTGLLQIGIYPVAPVVPLQLLIDFKSSGNDTLNALLDAIKPLRERNLLTKVCDNQLIRSTITLVASGSYDLTAISRLTNRDIFVDAPLDNLTNGYPWNPLISPMASTKLTSEARKHVSEWVQIAHSMNLTTRFWGGPRWPPIQRNKDWQMMIEKGVDWINADDLREAAQF